MEKPKYKVGDAVSFDRTLLNINNFEKTNAGRIIGINEIKGKIYYSFIIFGVEMNIPETHITDKLN